MSDEQFRRRASLVLSGGGKTLDLSELKFTFRVNQSDFTTPNEATIRVYNLAHQTALAAESEFSRVTLSAGYEGSSQFGVIFDGDIKQTRRGRDMGHTVNSFLDIRAADGDAALLSGFVGETLQANATAAAQQFAALGVAAKLKKGFTMDLPPGALSRGKVLYGMARDYYRSLGLSHNGRVSVQQGRAQMVSIDSYIPTNVPGAEIVVLNFATGMVGVPEVTQEGVKTKCLLNPNIIVSGVVQLNNSDIQDLLLSGEQLRWPGRLDNPATYPGLKPITIEGDGYYKVLVCEHCGDTRGRDWYTEITGLALTAAPSAGGKVAAHA